MNQIHNPAIPFNAPIPGGVHPGKMIKIHGSVPPTAHRFAVNLLCGAMGDIALHVSPKFHEKHVVRNSVQNMHWGHEEKNGHFPLHHGQTFEMLILCDPHHFKIAFNGHHFCEFSHRISYTAITNIAIDGEVTIFSINFEGSSAGGGGMGFAPPHHSHQAPYIPPAGHVTQPYPPHSAGVGIPHPVHHNPIHHAGSPYPHSNTVYPPTHASLKAAKKQAKAQRKAQKKALKYGLPIAAGAGLGAYALHKGLHGHHGFHHHHHRSSSSSSSSSSD